MANLLKGAPVAEALNLKSKELAAALREKGITPLLATVRIGSRTDDISYERGVIKRAADVGVAHRQIVLPEDVSPSVFLGILDALSVDDAVHGILLFRPLPKALDEEKALTHLAPHKDVDGCTAPSLAGVFMRSGIGFAPCTAQSAMEILHYYGIDPTGKRVTVVGRSLVVGRPLAMLLMHENATVTLCHTHTRDMAEVTREADIVILCSGVTDSFGTDYFSPWQTVIDVGIGWSEEKQKITGDVRFEEVEPVVNAITPVPGGVGAVTTAVLMRHVLLSALGGSL